MNTTIEALMALADAYAQARSEHAPHYDHTANGARAALQAALEFALTQPPATESLHGPQQLGKDAR